MKKPYETVLMVLGTLIVLSVLAFIYKNELLNSLLPEPKEPPQAPAADQKK